MNGTHAAYGSTSKVGPAQSFPSMGGPVTSTSPVPGTGNVPEANAESESVESSTA